MEWTLTDAALFKGVDVSAVSAVSDILRPVEYLAGHTFYTQGETGERLFIIVSGKSNCAGAHRMAGRVCSLCWALRHVRARSLPPTAEPALNYATA